MVRVSEKFLQQVTSLAKDGATTVNVSSAKFINVATPVNPTDGANKSYVDGKSFTLTLAEVLANGSTTGGSNITFTGSSPKIISSSPLEIQSDVKITGNVTSFNSGQVSFSDNNIFLNQNYTTAAAKSGGLVLNYLPTSTQTSIAATGFTAGVAGVSNPTVRTSGSSIFTAADFVMISGANNDNNNGLFEVLTHSANLLTIKGIGTIAAVQDFTQNQFVTDTTVAGTITKITISVLRAGTDGIWEVAKGSSTNTLNFTDLLTSTAGLSPTGPAGGDLISPTSANNYPNPLVKGFTTVAGTGTTLTTGTINTGELVTRSGTSLVGTAPTALAIAGNVTGTLGSSVVGAGTFNGTSLSFGNVNDGYLTCRSGTGLIGKDPLSLIVYGDVTGTLGNTDVVGGSFNGTSLAFGTINDGYLIYRSGGNLIGKNPTTLTISGNVTGILGSSVVSSGTFNGTSLTFGSVSDSTLLSRSGTSIVGTSASGLAVGGDASGTLGTISVNSLHFNGTQFALGPVGNTQLLQRVGTTITGIATDTFALKTYVDGYVLTLKLSDILTNGNYTNGTNINFNNSSRGINCLNPVSAQDIATKSYVDGYFPNTTMKQEIFTATTSQTVFNLSYSPINQQATEMFIDGVSQAVGIDYIVSGSTLTYIGVLVLGGEEIAIKYFTNLNLSFSSLSNDIVTMSPSGGSDDWPALIALVAAEYGINGRKRKIVLMPGNYKAATNFIMPPNLKLECMPGVDITCLYSPRNSNILPPYIGPFMADFNEVISSFHLSANSVEGALTVTATMSQAPVVGQVLAFSRATIGWPAEGFEIISVSGSGTYTITLDHPITYAFTTADDVRLLTSNKNIHIKGNGAKIHGPAERLLSIACGWDCIIEGFDVDGSQCTEFPCSIDTGSGRSIVRNGVTRNSIGIGFYTESNYRTTIENWHAINCVQGFGAWGTQHRLIGCTATGTGTATSSSFGFALGHVGTNRDADATRNITIENCRATNFLNGLSTFGAQDCNVINCKFSGNGINVQLSSTQVENVPTRNLLISGGAYESSVQQNIVVTTSSSLTVNSATVSKSAAFEYDIQSEAVCTIIGGYVYPYAYDTAIRNAGKLNIIGVTLDGSRYGNGYTNYLVVTTGAHVTKLSNVHFIAGSVSDICVTNAGSGVIYTENISLSGTFAQGIGLYETSKWWKGSNGGFIGATTPVLGTAEKNFGTATLTGVTPVTLNFTPATASNQLFFNRKVVTGTLGHLSGSISAGVGGTIVSSGTETSTVEWEIK